MATRHPAPPCEQTDPSRDLVPLTVWPCSQTSAQYQRAGRYLPASTAHPGKMLPDLARRIIAAYSHPGEYVLDPMCGIGTTLIEAAALGRRAVGVELEDRWARLAVANCEQVLTVEQQHLVEVHTADARRLSAVLHDVAGTVDLIVVSPPYGCAAGVIDKPGWIAGHRMCPPDTLNYGGPANLGHARGNAYAQAMTEIYTGCYQLLKPGGLLVTVTKNTRRKGRLFDLAGLTVTLCQQAGFGYLQHVVALLAAVRDGALAARPSFWQLTQTRAAISRGEPAHLTAHEDVLLFAKSSSR
ncbi:MAG TPA: DNA methyltransferase [Mycobacteriales bacterium]|nr:DNA methyltransferase [Mycobacteriales bacterium]